MEALIFTASTASVALHLRSHSSLPPLRRRRNRHPFQLVFASKSSSSPSPEGPRPELDKWDQMELKFGRLLGEDPKLTMAKIMAKKLNPDVSYLEVEKEFYKKKGKINDYFVDESAYVEAPPSLSSNLRKPSRKDTSKPQGDFNLNLNRPISSKGGEAMRLAQKPELTRIQAHQQHVHETGGKSSEPGVALRKPSIPRDDDYELEAMLKMKPNLFLKMRKDSVDNSSNVSLLKKPEAVKKSLSTEEEDLPTTQANVIEMRAPDYSAKVKNVREVSIANEEEISESKDTYIAERKPIDKSISYNEATDGEVQQDTSGGTSTNGLCAETSITVEQFEDNIASSSQQGLQPPKQIDIEENDIEPYPVQLEREANGTSSISHPPPFLGKPQRLESSGKDITATTKIEKVVDSNCGDHRSFTSADQEHEDRDWKTAEELLQKGGRAEVELISCSSGGFAVSFGSLIGFLPYRNLGAKWKFTAFESWLRRKGVDPSLYRQDLSILENYDMGNKNLHLESTDTNEINQNVEPSALDLKFEELVDAYNKEKTQYLSSFIGQRIRASVVQADKASRKLLFSGRPKERQETVEKKRNLMERLSIGDVVKCCITKITYFGIFVEVEGVPALIHQSEVSWDATLDPSSYYKIGQIVDAKVHQLDFALERITLSLKDITPDPLTEALESVFGDNPSMVGKLEAAQSDLEWADVDLLMKELRKIDGVTDVSKGRFFKSPGLAPTFQVYMASMFDKKYKLLARYENKVQEVIVESSLDKEQMKAAVLTCTSRVE